MDTLVLAWIQESLRFPVIDMVIPFFTNLGEWGVVWLALGLFLLFFPRYRYYGIGIICAVALAGILVNLGIKPLVGRPRPFLENPDIVLLIQAPGASSFPSGHAAASFAAATVVAFAPISRWWKTGAFALAALIAFTRLYLYVHYPSDVLFGMFLGVACGLAVGLVLRKHMAQQQELHSS